MRFPVPSPSSRASTWSAPERPERYYEMHVVALRWSSFDVDAGDILKYSPTGTLTVFRRGIGFLSLVASLYVGWAVLPGATKRVGESYAESACVSFLQVAKEAPVVAPG